MPRDASNVSVNYPKAQRIFDDRTLVCFRDGGHLAAWTYRISSGGGASWIRPEQHVVYLDAEPQDGFMADQAGSYHTICVSEDGRTLHVAFDPEACGQRNIVERLIG